MAHSSVRAICALRCGAMAASRARRAPAPGTDLSANVQTSINAGATLAGSERHFTSALPTVPASRR